MSGYLAYKYSLGLTKEEAYKTDQQVRKNQKEFWRGFKTAAKFSILMYVSYQLTKANSAHASDKFPDSNQVVPSPKPGHKPLSETTKGTVVAGTTAICASVHQSLQSVDFYVGLSFGFLLVLSGLIMNRYDNK